MGRFIFLLMQRILLILGLSLLLVSCQNESVSCKRIGVQAIGGVDQWLVDSIQSSIKVVYDFKNVVILPRISIPKSAFVNIKSPRYRADTLLRVLKRLKPDSLDYVIGILKEDISTTKRDEGGRVLEPKSKYLDWGIFGLGYRPGPSCVLSTFRIKTGTKELQMERMKKVCMHEIGHNLGLPHCERNKKCVMRDAAETIKTVDHVDLWLCKSCKENINK